MLKKNKWLLVIIVFAFSLRLYRLADNPPALNWDEVSHGYNAYSILKTGHDEWGKYFPITNFRVYGDYPLPLNLYLTIPFIASLGLSAFSIRLPHAILGTLTVLAVYYFVFGVTQKKKIALLASFLTAIEPWFLFESRFVVQSNLSVFFLTVGGAFFFNRKISKYFLPLSVLMLGLTLFSYHTTRIFSPLILIVALALYGKKINNEFKDKVRIKVITLFLLVMFFLPLPLILMNPEARARSNEVFLINQGAVSKIIEQRIESELSPQLSRLLYNRPVYFATNFVKNYLGYFSPRYLFFQGGTQYQFSVQDHGLLYLITLPFFYYGLYLLFKNRKKRKYLLLLAWLILAPIPAAITTERFAVLRSTTMLPIPQLLISIGFYQFQRRLKSYRLSEYLMPALIGILVLSLGLYLNKYFGEYRVQYSQAWQYGYRQAVDYIRENYGNYNKIVMTKKYGEPHEFVLFNYPWNPGEYVSDPNLVRFYQSNWYWVDSFDKFFFVNDWQINETDSGNYTFNLESKMKVQCTPRVYNCLLITSPGNVPDGWNILETINFLDGSPAFEIYEN